MKIYNINHQEIIDAPLNSNNSYIMEIGQYDFSEAVNSFLVNGVSA